MFFDDRLATVLRQRAQSDAMRRTQYRQLLDLLGAEASSARSARDPSLIAAAWMRMNKLAEAIPAKNRARLIAEPGWRLRNPEMVAHLADFEPEVASAALTRAHLPGEDWSALIPRLPVRARGFLRLRRDLPEDVEAMLERLGIHDRGLPTPQTRTHTVGQAVGVEDGAGSVAEGVLAEEFQAENPVDLAATHELPGANIPPEDIPSEPLVGAPIGPFVGDDGPGSDHEASGDDPLPLRPIFFPKDKSARDTGEAERAIVEQAAENQAAEEQGAEEQEGFEPQPFTIEELRQIAEEPLNIEETQTQGTEAEEPEDQSEVVEELRVPAGFEADAEGRSEISALVERIANFQRTRDDTKRDFAGRGSGARGSGARGSGVRRISSPGDVQDADLEQGERFMPRLPLGEEDEPRVRIVRGFAFAADAAGRIEWAEEEVAPMVVGTRLIASSRQMTGTTHSALTAAFNARQPMKTAPLTLEGAPTISGDWVVDAQPRFSQIGGFAGYVGRMRRPIEAAQSEPSPAQREADRIRQLLHELRTPVTAVQGYSEVIQQQLFGSAPHEYRALAAAIASDAARILAGFEELDCLARLETGTMEVEAGRADITALTQRIVRQLAQVLDARISGIDLNVGDGPALLARIDQDSAENLMWRLLASIGGGCAASETLQATLELEGDFVRLTCDLPMQLQGEEDLFAADARPQSTAINPGLFGAGFALRLARAEARAGGGDLVRKGSSITLTLPQFTGSNAGDVEGTAQSGSDTDCAAQ